MAKKVLVGELPPRGRSIQAGSLCYNNGYAVEVVARLDAGSDIPILQLLNSCLLNSSESHFSRMFFGFDKSSNESPLIDRF